MEPALQTPDIDWAALSPLLVVLAASTVSVLAEVFTPEPLRRRVHVGLLLAGFTGALVAVALLALGDDRVTLAGRYTADGPALFMQGTLLLLALLGTALLAEDELDETGGELVAQASSVPGSRQDVALATSGKVQTEVYPLLGFAVLGMLVMGATDDLLVMFVALEVLSLPLYLMAGLARRRRLLSQEAAVKYFLLGAFSSAFFVYGASLLYGYSGGFSLSGIGAATQVVTSDERLLPLGIALLSVGLLFKVSAVPFHSWTPDVYQGAPTPVTAIMSAATKVAAFTALLRVFYVAFPAVETDWRPALWTVAVLTMVGGAVLAITQTDVKRMLAYSSVAHAGFLLVGVAALEESGISATLFYLLTYGVTSLGAFALLTLVRDGDGEATRLSSWAGLGRTSPLLAGVFALFLFALAGIPLTSGFTGKFAVFAAGVEGGATALVVVAVVASAIAAFFYARVVVLMFFTDPGPDAPTVSVGSTWTTAVVSTCAVVTVALGVFPGPVLELADRAGLFVA